MYINKAEYLCDECGVRRGNLRFNVSLEVPRFLLEREMTVDDCREFDL